jgi:maleylpyruvate isomerase
LLVFEGASTHDLGTDENAQSVWFRHWVKVIFSALDGMLASDPCTGLFCLGDRPGLADICLYAQVWNNRHFAVNMAPYRVVSRIFSACGAVEAFKLAAPPFQPDAE